MDWGSRASGDSSDSAFLLDSFVSVEFVWGHGVHDEDEPFDPLDGFFFIVFIDEIGSSSWKQGHERVQGTQFQNGLKLSSEIPDSELALFDFLKKFGLVFGRDHVFDFLHKLFDISLAE